MPRAQRAPKGEKHRHPYADADYRVFKLEDGSFGVELTIPDVAPTKITSFPSRTAAKQWVAGHKATVDPDIQVQGAH